MNHRIRGVALIVRDGRILLAAHDHRVLGKVFWEPPGGGWEVGDASILETARREAFEETGMVVRPSRIVYLAEYVDHSLGIQYFEVTVLVDVISGEPSLANLEPQESSPVQIVDVRWFTREELAPLRVHHPILKTDFWDDLAAGFPTIRHLGRLDVGHGNGGEAPPSGSG